MSPMAAGFLRVTVHRGIDLEKKDITGEYLDLLTLCISLTVLLQVGTVSIPTVLIMPVVQLLYASLHVILFKFFGRYS
jgi:hypothetical protein